MLIPMCLAAKQKYYVVIDQATIQCPSQQSSSQTATDLT